MIPHWIPKLDHLREAYHYHPHHFTDDEQVPEDLQKDLHETLRKVVSTKRRRSALDLRESFKRFQSRRLDSRVPLPLKMIQRDIEYERRRSRELRKFKNLYLFVETSSRGFRDTERRLERSRHHLKEMKRKCKHENKYLQAKIKLMRKNYTNLCDEISRVERSLLNRDTVAQDTEIVAARDARDDMMRAIVPKIQEQVQMCLDQEIKIREEGSVSICVANERVSRAVASEFQKAVFETDYNLPETRVNEMKVQRVQLLSNCCEDLISEIENLKNAVAKPSLRFLTSQETNRIVRLHESLQMSSDQCCLFWEVCDRFRYEDVESSQHVLDEVSVVNLLDVWHNELCELRFLSKERHRLCSLKTDDEHASSSSIVLYNSERDNMLASLFKAHEMMETRIKPLRVPFGEIHVLDRTFQNIASCYVDVASFLRTNEASDLSSQDRSAVCVYALSQTLSTEV